MPERRTFLTFLLLALPILALLVGIELAGDRLLARLATSLCISLVLVLGLQLFMGNSGILSFAHIGFMGVGAYASALLTIPARAKAMALPDLYPFLSGIELSPYLAMPLAALFAAAVAAVVAYPLMRLSDAAAVITSFALLVVLHTLLLHWSALTNGPRTLFGLPRATDPWLAGGCAMLAILIALVFRQSRTGLLLRASRDDEVAAAAIGVNIPALRWRAFVLSALLAGLGGALWGHFVTSFSPRSFYLRETFVVLGMLVIGGAGTVSGAVIGTFLVTGAFEGLRWLEAALNRSQIFAEQVVGLTEIVLALAMIGVLIVRPGGLCARAEVGQRWRWAAPGSSRSQARGRT